MYETMVLPTEEDFLASADPDVLASLRKSYSHCLSACFLLVQDCDPTGHP